MRRQTRRLVVMAAGVLCLLVGMGWHFGVVSGQPTPSPSPIGMATPAPSPARIARPPIDNDQPPPALIAQVSETEKPQPLTLTRVVTDVTVVGFLAETRTTLTFRNDFARVLEGELVFPLPEGATVSGYALDVNGVMIDGVVVGQREARIAFEKETRKGVDPGLVEWVKGSSFKTRVFPIPPNGTRTIRIDTVSDLVTQGDVSKLAALYHLPLRYPNAVGEFSLRVEVVKPSAPPEVRSGSLANFRFARFEERYVAETRLHDARLTEDLMIALPQVPRENVVVERGEDGEFYFTIDDFPAIPALAPMQAKRIAVLWDASLSRAKADHARELRLLRSLIARLKDVEVDLTIFREVSQKTERIAIRGGQCESLLKRIETLPYDGATDLSALRVEKDVAYALLFSDGIGTLKEGLPDAASVPIFTINGDAQADHGVLRHMAERSGGAYFNLARLDDESVMTALGVRPFVLAGVDCNEKEITDLLPSGERPVQGRVTITGRLMVPEARVVLRYGKGEAAQMRTYTLRQSDAARTHLVSRYWAQQRIAELSVFAERNHDEIVSLGRRFGIVTPGTSLLVLETVEQYLEHGIEPPRSQPQMREEYLRLSQERVTQKTGSQKAKLERVAQMWKQRTDWWARDFKYDPQQIAKQTADGRRQRNGGHAEADRSLSVQESRAPMRDEVLGVAEAPAPPPPSRPADAPARAGSGMAPSATQEVMADAAKQKKSNGDGEHASAATIAIQAWDPKTPYLAAMKAVPLGDAYAVYLKEREKFGQSPAFFLDCADFFLRAKERALGLRILTNIVELKLEDARLLRVAAHRLEQAEALDWA
ncbi:MAG: hypothetical protein MUF51_09805, partial [Vicinamibacteria bacterium]|nr:hypothetical protein [Vicinamibacteria bacterium]